MANIDRPSRGAKRHFTAEQHAALQQRAKQARMAAAATGLTPRHVRINKITEALTMVHRWGCTSPRILDNHVQGRSGLARDLIKALLLDEHPVPGPGRLLDLPSSVVTLTEQATEFIEPKLSEATVYSGEVPWHQLRHDLAVQRLTLAALRKNTISDYRTPAEIAVQSVKGRKQPDAVWVLDSGERAAFELELTVKKGREFEQTCLAIIKALDRKLIDAYDLFIVASPSPAILGRYRNALRPDVHLPIWERNPQRQWKQGKVIDVPGWIAGRVIFTEVAL